MLQNDVPEDFVIATGKCHSVRDFVEETANQLGLDINWDRKGVNEKSYDKTGKIIVTVNKEFFRPREVSHLVGDSSKAKEELGWEPKTNFQELVRMMIGKDLELLSGVK